jgi:hypothetical protein
VLFPAAFPQRLHRPDLDPLLASAPETSGMSSSERPPVPQFGRGLKPRERAPGQADGVVELVVVVLAHVPPRTSMALAAPSGKWKTVHPVGPSSYSATPTLKEGKSNLRTRLGGRSSPGLSRRPRSVRPRSCSSARGLLKGSLAGLLREAGCAASSAERLGLPMGSRHCGEVSHADVTSEKADKAKFAAISQD